MIGIASVPEEREGTKGGREKGGNNQSGPRNTEETRKRAREAGGRRKTTFLQVDLRHRDVRDVTEEEEASLKKIGGGTGGKEGQGRERGGTEASGVGGEEEK
jgi:hypothetical protein